MWKIFEDQGNRYLFIVYPFPDKDVTFGFTVKKRDLFDLYLQLYHIFEQDEQISVPKTPEKEGRDHILELHAISMKSSEQNQEEKEEVIQTDNNVIEEQSVTEIVEAREESRVEKNKRSIFHKILNFFRKLL